MIIKGAEELRDPSAIASLGLFYLYGEEGFEKDVEKAIEKLTESYKMGCSMALPGLCLAYTELEGEECPLFKSFLRECSEKGDKDAASLLDALEEGGNEPLTQDSLDELRLRAVRGDVSALYELGERLYLDYDGKDPKLLQEGKRCLEEAAEREYPPALAGYGMMLLDPGEPGSDPSRGFKMIERGAAAKDPECQMLLADIYRLGKYVKADEKKAFELYRRSAESGYPAAFMDLGKCYFHGLGTRIDYGEAVSYFNLALKNGDPWASTYLGYCLEYGLGVDKNVKGAIESYEIGFGLNNAVCAKRLAYIYRYGADGVEIDINQAEKFDRAALILGYATIKDPFITKKKAILA